MNFQEVVQQFSFYLKHIYANVCTKYDIIKYAMRHIK